MLIFSSATGPAITKYRGLFEPQNTPFRQNGHGLGPIKRLWMFLVRQECIQNFFIKFIFGRKAKPVNLKYVTKQNVFSLFSFEVINHYFFRGINTDILHESASFISDANTAIAAAGHSVEIS